MLKCKPTLFKYIVYFDMLDQFGSAGQNLVVFNLQKFGLAYFGSQMIDDLNKPLASSQEISLSEGEF